MKRVVVLIDGYNVYHAIDINPTWHKYKWLNYAKLAQLFIPKTDKVEAMYYFTALATWMPDKMARHRLFIRTTELQGVNIVYGLFKVRDKFCTNCKTWYKAHEEKQTDVNIATYLFRLAVEDRYDKALILSGDSDLVPAIKEVRATFPNKQVGVIIPIGRRSEELKLISDFYMRMKEKHLRDSRFPESIDLGAGQTLECPQSWRVPPQTEPPTA